MRRLFAIITGAMVLLSAGRAPADELLTEATTPWLKEHLGSEIARHEQIAQEIERASKPAAADPDTPAR